MKRKSLLFIIGALLICSVFLLTGYIIHNNKEDNNSSKYDSISKEKNTSFDLKLVKSLYTESDENLLYAPLSTAYTLSMLSSGAKGNVLKEINYVLNNYDLTKKDNIEGHYASVQGLWINDIYKSEVKSNFVNALKINYESNVLYDSFENSIAINKWLYDNTYKVINVYDNPVIKTDVMNVINANFFSPNWKYKFDEKLFEEDKFYLKDGTSINAQYFKGEEVMLDADNFTGFAKEYENGFTFYGLFPKTNVEDVISSFTLDKLNGSLSNKKAIIRIPRFDYLDYVENITDGLTQMGLEKSLTAEGKYSLIGKNIFVSSFNELNLIDFRPEGTMSPNEISNNENVINFEKSFIFIVKENNKDNIYFMGIVNKPVEIMNEENIEE